jgi:hypothetical protein
MQLQQQQESSGAIKKTVSHMARLSALSQHVEQAQHNNV